MVLHPYSTTCLSIFFCFLHALKIGECLNVPHIIRVRHSLGDSASVDISVVIIKKGNKVGTGLTVIHKI